MTLEVFDKFSVFLFCFMALVFFYQSWMNLVKRQLTSFSLDAIMLLWIRVIREKDAGEKAKQHFEEPTQLRILGLMALLSAFVALYLALEIYYKHVQ